MWGIFSFTIRESNLRPFGRSGQEWVGSMHPKARAGFFPLSGTTGVTKRTVSPEEKGPNLLLEMETWAVGVGRAPLQRQAAEQKHLGEEREQAAASRAF